MKKSYVFVLVLLLAIGFAGVATNLVINGTLNLGFNATDFESDVIFTRATSPYGKAIIGDTQKTISFETEKLENVNQTSVLEFDITNKSRNYDASVRVTCGLEEAFTSYSEYISITNDLTSPFELAAGSTKTGHINVEMIKAFNDALNQEISFVCTMVATPKERSEQGSEYTPSTKYTDSVLNGADPVLDENNKLIPVTLASDGTVTYADINSEWYNYENKEWANAVILVDTPTKEYQVGNIIKEDDIESYFVWIPRYRYQIFDEGNYTEAIEGSPTEESIAKEIQIEFESLSTTPSTGSTKDSWLTHPAFTNFNVNGLWVGKYETGYNGANTKEEAQVNEVKIDKVIVKPNVYSWRSITVSNMFKTAYNYERDLDSHMIKNTEWGAAAYLSHSKYGINTEVRINNNSDLLTGYSAAEGTDQTSIPGTSGTDSSVTLPYNTETGYKSSTTGNITGIYDMSGGAWEYVAGHVEGISGDSGFTTEELTTYSKYLDVYPNNSTITSYSNRILGDATGEMGPFYYYADNDNVKRYHDNWYDDDSFFVDSSYPWFYRGGDYASGVLAGQFYSSRYTGVYYNNCFGSRLVLAI